MTPQPPYTGSEPSSGPLGAGIGPATAGTQPGQGGAGSGAVGPGGLGPGAMGVSGPGVSGPGVSGPGGFGQGGPGPGGPGGLGPGPGGYGPGGYGPGGSPDIAGPHAVLHPSSPVGPGTMPPGGFGPGGPGAMTPGGQPGRGQPWGNGYPPPPRHAALAMTARIAAVVLVALGLSIPFDSSSEWGTSLAWSIFAMLAALVQLAPAIGSGFGWTPARSWTIGALGTAALVIHWVLIMLPGITSNAGFCLTLATAGAVAACWLSPGRRW